MSTPLNTDQQEEIEEALFVLGRTGEISDCLLPGFDQNGRWRGIRQERWFAVLPSHLTEDELKLDPDRITERIPHREGGGIRLKTSYHYQGEGKIKKPVLKLEYSEIEGNLGIKYPLIIELSKLRKIKGHLQVGKATVVSAPKLQSVGGTLSLAQAAAVELFCLEHIGEHLYLPSCSRIDLPKLRSVGGHIQAEFCKTFLAPKLKSIEGSFYFGESVDKDFCQLARQLTKKCLQRQIENLLPRETFFEYAQRELKRREIQKKIEKTISSQSLELES